ncbi:MAG: hypothetical protein JST46_01325 [Bacteroidetes bacterium]|nr:hypothetical protein [Bacteroidota bacterium]
MENLPDIRLQLSRKDLFETFRKQLGKEFDQNNFPGAFVETLDPNYDRIHQAIVDALARQSKQSDFNLAQLLYRIDISEAQMAEYIVHSNRDDHFDAVAELIIKRVLQKVVVRQYYKNKDGNG